MDINIQKINRENLNQEIEIAQKMAAEIEKELRESSQTQNVNLQNVYDSASDERDLNGQIYLHQFAMSRIHTIRKSIQAMESGTYGTCCDCGCQIEERRLALAPESTTCILCQVDQENVERLEKEKFVSTPGLQNMRSFLWAA